MVNRVMIPGGDLHLTHTERKTDIHRPTDNSVSALDFSCSMLCSTLLNGSKVLPGGYWEEMLSGRFWSFQSSEEFDDQCYLGIIVKTSRFKTH